MRRRKLGIILTRSLLSMLIFSLLFVLVTDLNFGSLIRGLFGDIYDNADAASKRNAITNIQEVCDQYVDNQELEEFLNVCQNPELREEMAQNCRTYFDLRANREIEVNAALETSCLPIVNGQIDAYCGQVVKVEGLDVDAINAVCRQRGDGTLDDKGFFVEMLMVTVPPNSFSVKSLLLPLSLAILGLIGILMLLHDGAVEMIFTLGRVLFNVGLLAMLIFTSIFLFSIISPLDTSFLLESLAGEPDPELIEKALPILIPIVISRIFNRLFLFVGFVVLVFGFMVKVIFKKGKI